MYVGASVLKNKQNQKLMLKFLSCFLCDSKGKFRFSVGGFSVAELQTLLENVCLVPLNASTWASLL